jgi:uncharacterized protein with HEPN domain
MRDDNLFITQILDSIRKIESYTSGFNKESFLDDEKTQSAVVMQLTLIGEISKKISDNTKNNVNLPWKDIAGFRDRAIHNYFDIDINIVWNTVKDDVPTLKKELSND